MFWLTMASRGLRRTAVQLPTRLHAPRWLSSDQQQAPPADGQGFSKPEWLRQDEEAPEEVDPAAMEPLRPLTDREMDFVGFDKENILQEEEDERAHFKDLVRTYGQHLVARPDDAWPEREYVVSEDAEEWRHVENLMPVPLIPAVPAKASYPSGFRMPTAKRGDYPYFVSRTVNHMLPVYCRYTEATRVTATMVRRADGDLFALRDDLKSFLWERYRMDFISQVAEVYGRVLFRGDFEQDFKEFLLDKGF